jgi:glutaredoxin 3
MATITLYTRRVCAYCDRAKALMQSLKLDFNEISLEGDFELFQKLSRENGGWRTVPMIFVGKQFIGGFDDLAALHKKGALLPMVLASQDDQPPESGSEGV